MQIDMNLEITQLSSSFRSVRHERKCTTTPLKLHTESSQTLIIRWYPATRWNHNLRLQSSFRTSQYADIGCVFLCTDSNRDEWLEVECPWFLHNFSSHDRINLLIYRCNQINWNRIVDQSPKFSENRFLPSILLRISPQNLSCVFWNSVSIFFIS